MVQRTHGPCPSRVSDVVVKCHWYVGVVCLFLVKAGVKYQEVFMHCLW